MANIVGRDIIISANNNEEVMVLPVVPSIPVRTTQENEAFKTAGQGYMNLIGDIGLREFNIDSILPVEGSSTSVRPGSVGDPFLYIDFFNKWRNEKVPFRVIASRPDGSLWFNLPMTIDDFSYELLKTGSVKYQLSLKEYVFHWELVGKW